MCRSISCSLKGAARRVRIMAVLSALMIAPALSPGTCLQAQQLRQTAFMNEVRVGFDAIYNLDYDQATQSLLRLRAEYPEHPAPPLYLAVVHWLKELFEREDLDLDRFVAPGYFAEESLRKMPVRERKTFFDFLKESRGLCEAILEKHPQHKDARYLLGAGHGIEGSFAITIDRSVRQAFKHGKKAYKIHKKLIEEDPEYFDAYMSVGVYEYVVANLPWYIKWFATIIGYRGSEERGFEYLNTAAERGSYVANDARTLQMVLYIREDRHQDALRNALKLHGQFPRNPLLHINRAQILELMGHKEQAVRTYREALDKAASGVANYDKIPLSRFRYTVARRFQKLGHRADAIGELELLIEDDQTPGREKALAHLSFGQIRDLQKRRPEAIAHYNAVLSAPPYGDSHARARRFLKREYQGE